MARKKKGAKKKPVVTRNKAGKVKINRAELRRREKARSAAVKTYEEVLGGVIDRLNLALENSGYTPNWLAQISLLSPGTVYRLLDARTRFPQLRTLEYLASALNVPLWWLVHGDAPPKFAGIDPKAVRPTRRAA